MKRTILVTGGSGLIGKALQEILPEAIYLSSEDCDLTRQQDVETIFNEVRPKVVIHMAARVGGLYENMKYKAEFYDQNILMNTFVLQNAYKYGCKKFIGILSTCIYPSVAKKYPLTEDMLNDSAPDESNFGYAIAKRALHTQIEMYKQQYGVNNYIALIPSNIYGENDKYQQDRSHYVGALIRKIYEAKESGDDHIELMGTGEPLRQFLYAGDMAKVIKLCVEKNVNNYFNVCPDENLSIKKIAEIALKSCGAEHLRIDWDTSKSNGQMNKQASNARLKEAFPDFQFTPLSEGIARAYEHYKNSQK